VPAGPGYRRALWFALAVNAGLFVTEAVGGHAAESVSLWADALDFLGDSVTYALALAAAAMAQPTRSRLAWAKGLSMAAIGLWVIGLAAWRAATHADPEPATMGLIAVLALAGNVAAALALYPHAEGDSMMRSVWLCTRNDALGNLAVLAAAAGVFGTGTRWPDLAVAALMAGLALHSGIAVMRAARAELQNAST